MLDHYAYAFAVFASTVDTYRGEDNITNVVFGMFTNKLMTETEFSKDLQRLSKFLVDLLPTLLNTVDEVNLVKAYFVCFNQVLKFEYEYEGKP